MRYCRLLLMTVLLFVSLALSAQRIISGRITDSENGSPIPGASIFFSTTTVGTTTDAEGHYRLKIPGEGAYRLVVSHVGYQPVFKDITPGKTQITIDVAMYTHEMEEVMITTKSNVRNKDIDLFWKTILGKKPSKKDIQAMNPNAVYYYYNPETNKFTVTCRVPLQIVNHETGYHIQFVLKRFMIDYDVDNISWEGEYLFTELEPDNYKQMETWEINRKKIYRTTIGNFIKALYHDNTLEEGFLFVNIQKYSTPVETKTVENKLVFSDGKLYKTHTNKPTASYQYDLIDPDYFILTDSVTGNKSFHILPYQNVMMVSFGRPVTQRDLEKAKSQVPWERIGSYRNNISTPERQVFIYPDGSYRNPIRFTPKFNSYPVTGLNMMLPLDYHPDGESGMMNVFSENQPDEAPETNSLATCLMKVGKQFERQLSLFPQEKIYLQTDKPYYVTGERIWFRAHVMDAATHVPSFSLGSVFVELFDARDSVVSRIKTGPANDLYSGYLHIPEDLPEGDYVIRAYTDGMRDLDEDYFFMKSIRIGGPASRIMHIHPEFQFFPDKKISADIRFSRILPTGPITPEPVKISVNGEKPVNVKCDEGLSNFSFEFPHDQKQRVMLLDATYENNPFRQYIRIPFPDDDFDVSFYPEGGSVLYGTTGRIAFKALQRDGTEIDVSGEVYDSRGNEITRFKTDVRGMGQFMMKQEPGETYDAVCTNSKGESRRFRLPAAQNTGYVLSATWGREHLKVNVLQPESQKTGDTLCLIVHTRGIVQDARIWENTSEPLVFPKDFFLSGVSHLLLLTKEMVPVSERLVFVHNDDQAKVEGKTGRGSYPVRTPVEYTVHITDETGEPLIGNFSVSVTDGHEVTVDTTMNISTTLLLTSDLRGNIPDPGYYFREKGHLSVYSLDLLMQTQGWRRYDTERIIKNDLLYPDTLLQKGYVVSGTVRNRNRPVDGALVNILAIHGNYTGMSYTDRNGRFYLSNGDLPDSTAFIVQATSQGKNQNLELILDGVSYPERKIPVVAPGLPDRGMFAKYAGKAEQQYVDEHGVRISHIPEVTITASKIKGKDYSFFYKARDAQFVISEDDLKRNPPASINSLLNRIPGIFIAANTRSVTYGHSPVYFVVDDRLADDVFDLSPADIAQVDLLSGSAAATFVIPHPKRYDGDYSDLGQPSPSHVISITTRRGTFNAKETPYIKPVIPLGFQKPVEFYAPKYDTSTGNPKPDLRTTIHWQPNITTDEYGKASFSFYTADTPSTYTVVIEGMTEDGKMIYKRDQIVVENQ